MDHLGKGLIYNAVSSFSHLKGQIRILAVSRSKSGIKAANLLPQLIGKQNRRSGNIVHILHIIVFRLIRIIQTTVVPSRTITPDNTAGLLKAAVRVHQLGTNHTNRRIPFNQINQRTQPVFRHLRIVIQEHNILAPGMAGCIVAVAQKALVGGVAADNKSLCILR